MGEPNGKIVDRLVQPVGRAGANEGEEQNRGKNGGGEPFNPETSPVGREGAFG
jgi:hypothetical protein